MKSKKKSRTSGKSSSSEVLLIDTSVLIDHFKKRTHLELWGNAISTVTLLEFLRGVPGEERRKAFLRELRKLFKIEEIDDPVVLTYCKLYRALKRNGELIEDADLLIAATAIAKGYTLWTKNIRHFERLEKFGLKLFKG
ncbi:type II toxin-antitoxin system VapC family toxin [Thermococcus sp. M39]|uniref:type II toxin-antitoxin system VapC family toxin n=1 Tax=Thermococcus sp. M39 TaxID=1638262 RepID=UPI00143982CE|nr:type II toxin-antitoxin system VapC family toxin [Thermococcus sp. M39]NJE06954.1 type II toxin-antitoxin system VapC family toxin [Thermococcus sp. M39]